MLTEHEVAKFVVCLLYKYAIENRGRYEFARCTCPMREVTSYHVE